MSSLVPRLTPAFCIRGLGASAKSGGKPGNFVSSQTAGMTRWYIHGRHDHDVTEKLALSFSSYGRLHRGLSQAVRKLQARDKGLEIGGGLN